MSRLFYCLRLLVVLFPVLAAQSAQADQRVYAGSEAQALKCAAYYSYTAHVLESRGLMSTLTKEQASQIGDYILERHVSGTFEQKLSAYKIILKRMPYSNAALVRDTAKHLTWCSDRFL